MENKKGRPKSKKPKDEMIHFAYTKEEKNKLEDFAKKSNTSISEFIRQAILDKIRRIENPDLYNPGINFNKEFLEKILKNQKLLDERNQLILERLDTYAQIVNTLKLLKPNINNQYLKEKMEKMRNVLKTYEELKPKKLEELTGFNGNTIKDILAYYDEIFSITMKGGIKLNE